MKQAIQILDRFKVEIALSISVFLLLLYLMPGAQPPLKAHTIEIDGDVSDWTGTPPAGAPAWGYSGGEFIVTDPTGAGDTRDDPTAWEGQLWSDVDVVQFRVTANTTHIFFLIEFDTLDNSYTPVIFIAIDPTINKPDDGYDHWLWNPDGEVDAILANGTKVNSYFSHQDAINWTWVYLLVINRDLSDSGVVIYPNSSSYQVGGKVAWIENNPSFNGTEIAVPFTLIGGSGLYLDNTVRFWIATATKASGTDYGAPQELTGPNIRDVVGSTPAWETSNGAHDGEFWDPDPDYTQEKFDNYPTDDWWIDTYFDVYFNPQGDAVSEYPVIMISDYVRVPTFAVVAVALGVTVPYVYRRIRRS
mgnify:CR=1 FL=1